MGDDQFYRADKWNPDGYFEKTEFHAVNMPLINGPFGKLAYFSLPSTKTILRRSKRFSREIENISEKYKGKIVKETRNCLTLPAWLKYGCSVEKIIICLRDPIHVAYSLKKRNHAMLIHSYRLWYEHNIRILQHAKNIPNWFVYYHTLVQNKF